MKNHSTILPDVKDSSRNAKMGRGCRRPKKFGNNYSNISRKTTVVLFVCTLVVGEGERQWRGKKGDREIVFLLLMQEMQAVVVIWS